MSNGISNLLVQYQALTGIVLFRNRLLRSEPMQISARNALKGTVKKIAEGAVNTEVLLEVAPGVEITAIITKASVEALGLGVGKEAYAVIKSSDVMVAVD
jgi:molybdopterin-binding protein